MKYRVIQRHNRRYYLQRRRFWLYPWSDVKVAERIENIDGLGGSIVYQRSVSFDTEVEASHICELYANEGYTLFERP